MGVGIITMFHSTTKMRNLRKDRLTDEERKEALWSRQKPDRVPIWPLCFGFSAVNAGYSIGDYYRDPKKCADAQRWTGEQYGWQPIFSRAGGGTSFPAQEFGGEMKWPTGEYDQAPSVVRHGVETEEDVSNLKVPGNLEKLGTIPLMLESTAYLLEGGGGMICAPSTTGPMDTAQAVIGIEKTCKWMMKKPELVHRAFRVFTDFKIAMAKLWADTFGVDRLVPTVGGPSHSNAIISPKMFEEFCLPYVKDQHSKMRDMGYKHFFFHPCGEQNANMPFWAKCDMGDPGLISVGHEVPLETVQKCFPNDIAVGNLEPVIIQVGTPDQIYEKAKELILKGKQIPGGYVFAPGCELPPKAPSYNVWVMTKAVNDFGWYE
jgi:uroporphyrinogen decarboxylase